MDDRYDAEPVELEPKRSLRSRLRLLIVLALAAWLMLVLPLWWMLG